MLERIRRIPRRIRDDIKILRISKNWMEIFRSKVSSQDITKIDFRNGVKLSGPKQSSLNFLFHEIWIDEFYAPKGYEIRPGDVVIDIGGNIGVFALWAATRAKNVKVFSFEPFPENLRYFRKNVETSELKNILIYGEAIGGSDSVRHLAVSDSWILHSLVDDPNMNSIEVVGRTLDSVMTEIGKCDLLKLDCEGSEYEILYAASDKTLAKIDKIVCEFNTVDENERNGPILKAFLTKKGFFVDHFSMLDATCGFVGAHRK